MLLLINDALGTAASLAVPAGCVPMDLSDDLGRGLGE